MKKILIALGALVIVLAIALAVLVSQLDALVKYTVEEAGSQVTQVPVTLQQVDISARKGTASLSGFSVANPAGFSAEPAIGLGGISVSMDTSSLTSDVIVIREVSIDAPTVLYEMVAGKTNIGTIQNNIEQFTQGLGGGAKSGGGEQQEPAAESDGGKKLIIENLYLREGQITVRADVLKDGEKQVTLPAIHLKDIGKSEGGIGASEVAARIMNAVNAEIADAVKDAQIEGLREEAKTRLRDKVKSWFGGE